MSHVLTLIAGPSAGLADLAASLAEKIGAGAPDWLGPGEALDLPFDETAPGKVRDLCQDLIGDRPVDWLVQPVAGRRKAVFVADMESTIIGQEMLDELAEAIGQRDRVADITARAMAGELDSRRRWPSGSGWLRDLPRTVLDQVAGRMTLNPGARTLVRTLAANGARTALVSGGFRSSPSRSPSLAASTRCRPTAWASPTGASPGRSRSR